MSTTTQTWNLDTELQARQTEIDALERQLGEVFDSQFKRAVDEYRRRGEKVARTKRFLRELDADRA